MLNIICIYRKKKKQFNYHTQEYIRKKNCVALNLRISINKLARRTAMNKFYRHCIHPIENLHSVRSSIHTREWVFIATCFSTCASGIFVRKSTRILSCTLTFIGNSAGETRKKRRWRMDTHTNSCNNDTKGSVTKCFSPFLRFISFSYSYQNIKTHLSCFK